MSLTTPAGERRFRAAPFDLVGVDGKRHTLDSVRGENATVVMFICNHCPYVKAIVDKIVRDMSIVQDIRGGRDNDPRFGTRMKGQGIYADLIRKRFRLACARLGMNTERNVPLETTRFRPPKANGQLDLF